MKADFRIYENVEKLSSPVKSLLAGFHVAQQALLDMINDLTLRTTRRVPITDPTHRQVLGRLRPQLPEFEAQHRVQIHLQLSGLGAQGAYNDSDGPHQNDAEHSDTGQNYGYLVLTGRPDCIEACLESEILPLLPVHETFPMAVEFHRNLLSPPAPTEAQNRINSGKLLASGSRGGGTSNRRGFGARGEALVSGRQKFQQQQSVRGQQYQKQQTTASQPVNKQPEDDSEEPDELLRKVDILRRKYGVHVSPTSVSLL
ncbi:unnamed protein product [Protopolystoma xenopodis]|uniref:Uncharacterized protein n=1 Tax=Protopolystoma xenopodis TaxID=117903 RepID=A0A3S5CPP6_9PLAT|nr:unnamed protein product [Protopolystoma xenopodis]